MRIIQKNAWVGLFLATVALGTFNVIGAELTKPKSTAELEREAESMEWLVKTLPYPVSIVESDEDKEIKSITNQARILFQSKDFEKLDAFVKKLRDSKEQFAGGSWKFYSAYCGIAPGEDAPDAEWKNYFATLEAWTNARPQSITARVALANAFVSYAWKARGSGWASDVTEDGWKLFAERLSNAMNILKDTRSLKEQCPFAWSVLLETELGVQADRKTYDATFKQAVTAWPDYKPFYQRRAWYLLPRWNGEEGEWEADLAKSADKIGGEDGDILYARVVWCMHQNRIFSNIFTENKLSWERVNKGFEAIEKRFPNSLSAKSEHAYLAALAPDAATTKKYIDLIRGKVDITIWHNRQKFLQILDWSSVQEDFAKAAELERRQHQSSTNSQAH